MEHLHENIGYLRGLAEGLNVEEQKNGKIVLAIIDCLDEMAYAINQLSQDVDEVEAYVEEVDKDLAEVEDFIMELDDEFDEFDLYDDEFYDEFNDDDFEYSEDEITIASGSDHECTCQSE